MHSPTTSAPNSTPQRLTPAIYAQVRQAMQALPAAHQVALFVAVVPAPLVDERA